MRLIQTLSSCLCTGIIALFTACSQAPQSPIDSVNPFIGTGFHGHTYPGPRLLTERSNSVRTPGKGIGTLVPVIITAILP